MDIWLLSYSLRPIVAISWGWFFHSSFGGVTSLISTVVVKEHLLSILDLTVLFCLDHVFNQLVLETTHTVRANSRL